MTRFARASGSKSSNKKVPEDSTPWSVLKEQVLKKNSAVDENCEKETDWKAVLDTEKSIEKNKNTVWCEFEDKASNDKLKNSVEKNKNVPKKEKLNKKRKLKNNISTDNISIEHNVVDVSPMKQNIVEENILTDLITPASKKIKTSLPDQLFTDFTDFKSDSIWENGSLEWGNSPSPKKKKKKSKGSNNSHLESITSDLKSNEESALTPVKDNNSKKKTKSSKISPKLDINTSDENQEVENNGYSGICDGSEENKAPEESIEKQNNNGKPRNKTLTFQKGDGQPFKRRKIDQGDVEMKINGEDVLVTRLDGFYVRKEDAEKIREKEKELVKRGVSNQDVREFVKKERRNAEKSLSRLKKKVCFHCRKGGHTLSSCPNLEQSGMQTMSSGICYKCGSTEHTHFQCRVSKGDSFKFATCFVCKEEGHISRQCPNNPRGLYPTGGGCKLCGDVTHFRRDCPTQKAKQEKKMTVDFFSGDVEGLEEQKDRIASKKVSDTKKNKIIKFN